MTIYIDLILLLNLAIDFILLLTVNITLKRNTSLLRIFLGSLIGSLSILFLFLPLNSISLFFLKIIISILMSLITFKYKSLKYTFSNLLYLYMTSVILGGFLYFLNIEFSYKNTGIVFFHNGLSINFIFLIIISPIILYIYIRQIKELKNNYSCYYKIEIVFLNNKSITLNSFLDTGNKLRDPITKKNIILVEASSLKNIIKIRSPIYVPYNSLNNHGLLKCIKPKYIIIENKIYKNYLIGISEQKFNIDGISCILNYKLKEELNC